MTGRGPESAAAQPIKPIINKSIGHKIKHFALHLLSEHESHGNTVDKFDYFGDWMDPA